MFFGSVSTLFKLKKRKKNSSTSDISSGSISPIKKQFTNGFADEYRSSPEITTYPSSNSTPIIRHEFHSISSQQEQVNGDRMATNSTQQQFNNKNGDHCVYSPDYASDIKMVDVVSQNGKIRHSIEKLSTNQFNGSNSNGIDSDNSSSMNGGQRQPRTTEDFYLFCQFILEYENYNEMSNQEVCYVLLHLQ